MGDHGHACRPSLCRPSCVSPFSGGSSSSHSGLREPEHFHSAEERHSALNWRGQKATVVRTNFISRRTCGLVVKSKGVGDSYQKSLLFFFLREMFKSASHSICNQGLITKPWTYYQLFPAASHVLGICRHAPLQTFYYMLAIRGRTLAVLASTVLTEAQPQSSPLYSWISPSMSFLLSEVNYGVWVTVQGGYIVTVGTVSWGQKSKNL